MNIDTVIEVRGATLSVMYVSNPTKIFDRHRYWAVWSNRRQDWFTISKNLEESIVRKLMKGIEL